MGSGGRARRHRCYGRDAIMIDDGVSADAVWNESSSSSPRARRSIVESMSLRKSDPAPLMLMPSVRNAERMMIMPLRANKPVSPTPSSRRNHGANIASMACSALQLISTQLATGDDNLVDRSSQT